MLGAYPLTTEPTAHRIAVFGNRLYAMCALDALSVAPLFDTSVDIESRCHQSSTPIRIRMQGRSLPQIEPSEQIRVGIRWQNPSSVAAHSLCLQMLFLRDAATAAEWQSGDIESTSLFALKQAIEFGCRYFTPLLQDSG